MHGLLAMAAYGHLHAATAHCGARALRLAAFLQHSAMTPDLTWVLSADIEISARRPCGVSAKGAQFLVEVLGGTALTPLGPGVVLPGGICHQWLRDDGVRELQATYTLQMHDGLALIVHSAALFDEVEQPLRYACSHVRLQAPANSLWAWVNRRILVGTVTTLRPQRDMVQTQLFLLGDWPPGQARASAP